MSRTYRAVFWRSMPKSVLEAGGYETERAIVARSRDHAMRKALRRERRSLGYADMRLLRVERV